MGPVGERPKRWIVPIPYSDVFGRRPTRDNLVTFVRPLPYADLVAKCAAIALLSWQRGIEDQRHQADLVHNLLVYNPPYARKIREILAQDTPRVLFTRETLLALIRVAVVEQSVGQPCTEAQYADNFVRAALAANQLIYDELMPEVKTKSAADLIASELRSAIAHIDNPHILLGRTNALFVWSKTNRAIQHPDHLVIDDDLRRFTGLNHMEFAAGAYAVLARTAAAKTFDQIKAAGVVFDVDAWLNGVRDSRVPRMWLDVCSISEQTLRDEWRTETSLSYAGAGSLYRRPVMTVENGLRITPTPALLANAMGDGIYFALLDSYGSGDKEKLSRYYGSFFEDYVVDIFERGYAPRGAFFRREVFYRPGVKSSDAFICDNGDVFFVEVVAKRMNLIKSVLRLDASQIETDLQQGVLKKIRQLQRNVDDFRSGVLFPEVERKGARIFPILVSPKAFPRIYVVANLVKTAQKEERLLIDTEPIELLTVDEVESIEGDLAAGLNLGNLLHRKNCSTPQRRFMTLNNYLIDEEPTTATVSNLAQRRGDAVATEMVDLMVSWGLPRSV